MLVPFRSGDLAELAGEVTPVMEADATREVREIGRAVARAAARITVFLRAHPHARCRCPFCAAYPHALGFLGVTRTTLEAHADFLDDCRPPTADEFREFRDEALPVVRGG